MAKAADADFRLYINRERDPAFRAGRGRKRDRWLSPSPRQDGSPAARSGCPPYRPQSSSASRFTAGPAGFLNFSQSGERPDRYRDPSRFETIPQPPLAGVLEDQSCSRCSLSRIPCLAFRKMLASVALRTSIGSRRKSAPFSSSRSKAYRNAHPLTFVPDDAIACSKHPRDQCRRGVPVIGVDHADDAIVHVAVAATDYVPAVDSA
jgi:hypothetical protein